VGVRHSTNTRGSGDVMCRGEESEDMTSAAIFSIR
jgi:hypothetical protein